MILTGTALAPASAVADEDTTTAALPAAQGSSGLEPSVAVPCPDEDDMDGTIQCFEADYLPPPYHDMQVFVPYPSVPDTPAVLLIPGGGWTGTDTTKFYDEARYFAENGLAAFVINYTPAARRDPSWPDNITDVIAAAQYIHDHGQDFSSDGSNLAVFGGSSGGHMAALLSTLSDGLPTLPYDGFPAVPSIVTSVTWSGGMQLTGNWDEDGDDNAEHEDQKWNQVRMIGCPFEAPPPYVPPTWAGIEPCPKKYKQASPYEHVEGAGEEGATLPLEPTMLMFNSARENVYYAGARAMSERLDDNDVVNLLVKIRDEDPTDMDDTTNDDEGKWHAAEYKCNFVDVDYGSGPINALVVEHTTAWLLQKLYDDPTRAPSTQWSGRCPHPKYQNGHH